MLRHVSVLGPSSGSHIVLAKVTIKSHNNFAVTVWYYGSMPCCVVLYCEECPAGQQHARCKNENSKLQFIQNKYWTFTCFGIVMSCRSLILVMNCILLSEFFVLCINCKNMHGMETYNFKKIPVLFSLSHSVSAYYLCLAALLEILSMYQA